MIQSREILVFIGLALAASPAFAGNDKHEGQIEVLSYSWAVPPSAAPADGAYVITSVQHGARAPSSLGSLQSLGSSNDMFAARRAGDPAAQGPSGTGKTMSAPLLGKTVEKPPTQAMGDGSVRFLRDSMPSDSSAKRSTAVPTGTVTFTVDSAPSAGAGGAAKGAAFARK